MTKKNQRGCETRHPQEDHLPENAKRGRLDPDPSSGRLLYPDFERPTAQECRDVRDRLMALHGCPQEFEEYRRNADAATHSSEDSGAVQVKSEAGCSDSGGNGVGSSVLDGLVNILLSQNTTDANSRRAFLSLKSAFPTWDEVVHAAESKFLENAIRCGGLAHTKAHRIKNILKTLLENKGKICMEYLRDMPTEKIKTELHQFKGLGPKTVACLLMFHLQKDDFPVDTHVFRITKSIGWIPLSANREKAYLHLNQRIPDNLKFDLNCLFVTHGKHCQRCASGRQPQRAPLGPCPLSGYHAG
ncbi:putative DNA glycosylase [Nymphaea thermarum]|nr:putative DNA glycosylase [Nymphaea thermarum]